MLLVDDDAAIVLNNAINKYEKYFDDELPLLDIIESEHVTIDVALKLEKTVNKAIVKDEPIKTPKDYQERLY